MEHVQLVTKWKLYIYFICAFLVHCFHASNVCPIGEEGAIAFQIGGKCFEYVEGKFDWDDAVNSCESYGGFLAKMDKDVFNTKGHTTPNTVTYLEMVNILKLPYYEDMPIRIGYLTESTHVPFWIGGSPVLAPTIAEKPYRCGLLWVYNLGNWSLCTWEMHECQRKYSIICQYEPLDLTTMVPTDTTTPEKKPEKKNKKRRPTFTRKHKFTVRPVTSQSKKAAYMAGKPLAERKCPAVTMCSRICVDNRQCVCFNYNSVTFQCQLFDARHNVTYTDSPHWSVWRTGSCELGTK